MNKSPPEPPAKPPVASHRCPACGAAVDATAAVCWLCHEPQIVEAQIVEAEPVDRAGLPHAIDAWVLHASIWLGIVLTAILIYALSIGEKKYYAIAFAIVALPAIVITLGGATLGRLLNQPWHPAVKLSVGLAIALVLLPIAIVVALFIACIDLCSGFNVTT